MIERNSAWGRTVAGRDCSLWTLSNGLLTAQVTDLGAALVSLSVPDRNGRWGNVVIGSAAPGPYLNNSSYLGATVGRYANRIGRGRFWLDGKEYVLPINNGPNHPHGGIQGLTSRVWEADAGDDRVTFRTSSPDGEEGYPGNLSVSVTYRIEKTELIIEYAARCDAPTVINLTNHAYWNLSGAGSILDHQLQLFADRCLENDADVLPTGTILDVAGTPFDFRAPQAIGERIAQTAGGYDNCLVINDWNQATLRPAARVSDPMSSRVMEVLTTEPGVQLYTANHFDGSEKTLGFGRHEAFCLECQHFPDSPNQLEFPSTALRPGEEYRQATVHRFSIEGT
jgi:aldose 1-epimerase